MDSIKKYKIRKYFKENFNLKTLLNDLKRKEDKWFYIVMILLTFFQVGIMFSLSALFGYPIISYLVVFLIWRGLFRLADIDSNGENDDLYFSLLFTSMGIISDTVITMSTILLCMILPFWLSLTIGILLGAISTIYTTFSIIIYNTSLQSNDLSKSEMREYRLGELLKNGKEK